MPKSQKHALLLEVRFVLAADSPDMDTVRDMIERQIYLGLLDSTGVIKAEYKDSTFFVVPKREEIFYA